MISNSSLDTITYILPDMRREIQSALQLICSAVPRRFSNQVSLPHAAEVSDSDGGSDRQMGRR